LADFKRQENVWTQEEEQVFVKAFKKSGRDFYQLAQSLPERSVGDCIKFYYANKKRLNLKCRPPAGAVASGKTPESGNKDTVVSFFGEFKSHATLVDVLLYPQCAS
jgi:hypothetical protein